MWPYNEDEAGWLTAPERVEPSRRGSANDNDPDRRRPSRGSFTPSRTTPKN